MPGNTAPPVRISTVASAMAELACENIVRASCPAGSSQDSVPRRSQRWGYHQCLLQSPCRTRVEWRPASESGNEVDGAKMILVAAKRVRFRPGSLILGSTGLVAPARTANRGSPTGAVAGPGTGPGRE